MQILEPLEIGAEGPVELVVVLLVLDKAGARQEIEVVQVGVDDAVFESGDEVHEFPDGDRDLVFAEGQEEINQHMLCAALNTRLRWAT